MLMRDMSIDQCVGRIAAGTFDERSLCGWMQVILIFCRVKGYCDGFIKSSFRTFDLISLWSTWIWWVVVLSIQREAASTVQLPYIKFNYK